MKTLEEVFETWEAVIGLEIHAELTTLETKMFCGCKLEFGAAPNTHTCPVCLGLPGALPVPNRAAIESIVLAGLATNCDIEKHSMFYRKNYMYSRHGQELPDHPGPHRVLHAGPPRPGRGRSGRDRALPPGRARPRRDGGQHHAHRGRLRGACGHRRASTWKRTPARWCTSEAARAASPGPRNRSWTTTAPARP
ncbi:MAG: hypothetical protein ACLTDR_12105 [Adlercreutzia equolifaciens]